MALMDFFRPRWKHSSPEVRRAAVVDLTDQALCAEIVRTDTSPSVREVAVEKLADLTVLAGVAASDGDAQVRRAATRRRWRILLQRTPSDPEIRESADPAILADIAKTDSDSAVRQAAVENPRFSDQAVLADVASRDSNPSVREAAVRKLNDPAVLTHIAKAEGWSSVRTLALDRLPDAARAAVREWVDPEATSQSTDQQLLAEVAKAAGHSGARREAVKRLRDVTLLRDIAATDRSKEVRDAAESSLLHRGIVIRRPTARDGDPRREELSQAVADRLAAVHAHVASDLAAPAPRAVSSPVPELTLAQLASAVFESDPSRADDENQVARAYSLMQATRWSEAAAIVREGLEACRRKDRLCELIANLRLNEGDPVAIGWYMQSCILASPSWVPYLAAGYAARGLGLDDTAWRCLNACDVIDARMNRIDGLERDIAALIRKANRPQLVAAMRTFERTMDAYLPSADEVPHNPAERDVFLLQNLTADPEMQPLKQRRRLLRRASLAL